MASYLWRKYPPQIFHSNGYICAFYTGVIGSAIIEQLYKEKYWEEHPGEAVPLMKPKFYGGPWKVMRGEVPLTIK
ncbi:hypothetical protein M9H77_27725 [Catharanthus roseus]|uniref:Uncharacterized protein n=1 Tax=Catharanthus roseus TaxID=4058 RepID=A0ACC0ADB2_CATRO|nr:hypothetical protein M9H77_27725 [Catharanthus roseus]